MKWILAQNFFILCWYFLYIENQNNLSILLEIQWLVVVWIYFSENKYRMQCIVNNQVSLLESLQHS